MDKGRLHHYYRKLSIIRPWYFLVLAVAFLGIGIYGLRQNNFKMIQLRDAVITADKQNGDVETALKNLRDHVFNHMNTDLSSGQFAIKPPIQLKARYERLAAEQQSSIKAYNANVKARAERVCAGQYPGGGYDPAKISCIAKYISVHAKKGPGVPDELYKFDFVSPRWSPDLAGISLALASFCFLAFLAFLAWQHWARASLKQ